MKALITGVTGSGGSYLAEYILGQQLAEVIGTSRAHNPIDHKNISRIKDKVKLITVDLEDFSSLMRVIERELPDMIFHIASMANVRDSFDNPTTVVKNNVAITLNLLEVIRLLKARNGYNPLIQICSTSEVYGNVPVDYYQTNRAGINENAPLLPINPYAVSKLTQDALSYVYWLNYGLKIIRTRMFSYFNARRGNLFATAFAKQILNLKQCPNPNGEIIHGSLTSIRTLLDVRDAASAYWTATTKGKPGEVYNIGSNQQVSVEEVLEALFKKANVPVRHRLDETLLRPTDIAMQIPDSSKFINHTGWQQQYNFEQSIDFFWKEVNEYWSK